MVQVFNWRLIIFKQFSYFKWNVIFNGPGINWQVIFKWSTCCYLAGRPDVPCYVLDDEPPVSSVALTL